jgi:hypothetical protein
MAGIMDGLATYQIIKSGFGLAFIVLLLFIAIVFTINNMKKKYLSTTVCNIKSIPNSNYDQKLTYTVNGQNYEYIIPGVSTTYKNVTTTNYAHREGNCTLYYPKANPSEYSLNYNPTTVSTIFAVVLFIIAIMSGIWFLFLRSNREFAGVMGGISAADTIID